MIPTVEWMANKFNEFNKDFFEGKLHTPKFVVGCDYGQWGYLEYRANYNKLTRKITKVLSQPVLKLTNAYDRDEKDVESTLLHEMIHLYVYEDKKIYPIRQHNCDEFKDKAVEIRGKGYTIEEKTNKKPSDIPVDSINNQGNNQEDGNMDPNSQQGGNGQQIDPSSQQGGNEQQIDQSSQQGNNAQQIGQSSQQGNNAQQIDQSSQQGNNAQQMDPNSQQDGNGQQMVPNGQQGGNMTPNKRKTNPNTVNTRKIVNGIIKLNNTLDTMLNNNYFKRKDTINTVNVLKNRLKREVPQLTESYLRKVVNETINKNVNNNCKLKLTESELHNIIKESVKRILSEKNII
jgi:hypothetical protein